MKRQKAVSLAYPEGAAAPFITASGEGTAAEQLVSCAEKNRVPIVQNGNLTDILSKQPVGTSVPEETWTVLAKIFAYIIEAERENDGIYKN